MTAANSHIATAVTRARPAPGRAAAAGRPPPSLPASRVPPRLLCWGIPSLSAALAARMVAFAASVVRTAGGAARDEGAASAELAVRVEVDEAQLRLCAARGEVRPRCCACVRAQRARSPARRRASARGSWLRASGPLQPARRAPARLCAVCCVVAPLAGRIRLRMRPLRGWRRGSERGGVARLQQPSQESAHPQRCAFA